MYDGNLSLNSPDYRRKNLESSYRKNTTKLSRYRNITREHARHYRGNSLESMELVRFVRGPFTPPCRCIVSRGENRSARFSSPFSLRRAPNAATRRIGRSARDGTGRRKNNRYTTVCAETHGDKLAREKTRRRRRRASRESGRNRCRRGKSIKHIPAGEWNGTRVSDVGQKPYSNFLASSGLE